MNQLVNLSGRRAIACKARRFFVVALLRSGVPVVGSLLVAAFSVGIAFADPIPPPDPSNAWLFNEGSGDSVSDEYGTANGTLENGPTWDTDSPFPGDSGSLIFDGTDDQVVMPDLATAYNGLEKITMSFWIKSDAVGVDRGFWEAVDSQGNDAWGLRYDSAGASAGGSNVIKLGLSFDTSGGNTNLGADQQESMSGVQTTDWQHIAYTWESGVGFTLYIDGVPDSPTLPMVTTTGALAEMDRFTLGDGSKAYWQGRIGEVAVWAGEALEASEIEWLAQNSLADLSSGPRPPKILNISPRNGAIFHPAADGITFDVSSEEAISELTLVVNGTDVTGDLTLGGTSLERNVSYNGLEVNQTYEATITAGNSAGSREATISFDTFSTTETIVAETEDYNFSNGVCDTLTIGDPVSVEPTAGGMFLMDPVLRDPELEDPADDAYIHRVGMRDVDFSDTTADPTINDFTAHVYRLCDAVGTVPSTDITRAKHADAGVSDYMVNALQSGEWLNYTRTFTEGYYRVVLRASATTAQTVSLSKVISDRSQPNQDTVPLGVFNVPETGGRFEHVPLTNISGDTELTIELNGDETLRLTANSANDDLQLNYLLFAEGEQVILPTQITTFAPGDGATEVARTAEITVSVQDGTSTTLDPASVVMLVNGSEVTPASSSQVGVTTFTYAPTPSFGNFATIDVEFSFADNEGTETTLTWSFSTGFDIDLTFVAGTRFIEVEDFNYTDDAGNTGQWLPDANGGKDGAFYSGGAYSGLKATQDIDFLETGDNPDDVNSKQYRHNAIEEFNRDEGVAVGDGLAPEITSFDADINRDRGTFMVDANYKIGWTSDGDWYNFTRDFNAGTYDVYANVASGGANDPNSIVGVVQSDPTQYNQEVVWVGQFSGSGSGDWGTGAFFKMHEQGNAANPAQLTIPSEGVYTIRWQKVSGALDFNFLAFVPTENMNGIPVVTGVSPADGSANVAPDGSLEFRLADGTAVVNQDSITLMVNGEEVTPTSISKFLNFTVVGYTPDTSFGNSATVTAELHYTYGDPPVAADPVSVAFSTLPEDSVLLVVGNATTPNASDTGIRDRLESFGFTVIMVDDDDVQTGDANGMVLVVNSSTVSSGNVGTKFRDTLLPVINWEQANQDDFRMTGNTDGTDRGGQDGQTELEIVLPDHPMAAGLAAGLHQVTVNAQNYSWGAPNENAEVIATIAGNSARSCIYAYDTGATMIDGTSTAPARRVQLFFSDNVFANLTPAGIDLFDAALSWALDRELTPPTEELLIDSISIAEGVVTITWDDPEAALYSSDSVNGTYTEVPDASSPYPVDTSSGIQFFQLVK